MARTNASGEIWDALTSFLRMIDSTGSPVSIVSTGGSSAGATSLGVTVSTGFSTGDYIRVGPVGGSQVAFVESVSTGGVLTLRSPLAESASSGEAVRVLSREVIGCPDDNGVQFDVNTDITTINAACQRNAYAHLIGHTDAQVSVGLLNISWENLLATVGVDEANLGGAGTVADPTVAYWLPDQFDSVKPLHFAARGTLKDGTIVEVQFWDCDIDPAKSMALGRGLEVPLGLTFFNRITAFFRPAG